MRAKDPSEYEKLVSQGKYHEWKGDMSEYDELSQGVTREDLHEMLHELHGLFIVGRAAQLGLLESRMPKIAEKGLKVLTQAFERGWEPDWRVTLRTLEESRDPTDTCPKAVYRRLIRKIHEFRP